MRVLNLLGVLGLALGGCYGEYATGPAYGAGYSSGVTVAVPPPTPIIESPPPRPFYGAVWTAGFYDWSGGRYAWTPGRWTSPPRAGVVYMPPRWERFGSGYHRTSGNWVTGQTYDRFGRHVWYDALGRAHYM